MGRRLNFTLLGLGLAATLAWIGVVARQAPSAGGNEAAAAEINATIREKAAAVAARADTLAQLPRLTWAVATDASTVRDLSTEELSFRTHPGEHIEIAQIARRPDGADGAVRTLLQLPASGAPALPMSQTGTHLLVEGDRLFVVVVVAVEPRERVSELRGALAVAQQLELGAVAAQLDSLRVGAQVRTASGTVTLGSTLPQEQGATVLPLPAAAGDRATLMVSAPGHLSKSRWAPPIAVLILLLAAAGAVARRRPWPAPGLPSELRLSETSAPTASPARLPPPAPGPAPDAHPTPTFGVASLPLPSVAQKVSSPREPKPGRLPRTGSLVLPSAVFEKTGPTLRGISPGAPEDPSREEYQALFDEFVKLRRTCGEAVDEMNRDQFVAVLQNQRARLIKELAVKDVRFRLAFDNGKAAIRFTTST